MVDRSERLVRTLARANAIYAGIVVGLVLGFGLWLASAFLILQAKEPLGPTLGLLSNYLPGYTVSWGGAVVGALWLSVFAFLVTFPAAWLYFVAAFHHVEDVPEPAEQISEVPNTVARIRVPGFAAAAGLLCGGALLLATLILVIRGGTDPNTGYHLGLLSNYLPGYTVTFGGAFLGFLYFLFVGGALFAVTGTLYNALVGSSRQPRSN